MNASAAQPKTMTESELQDLGQRAFRGLGLSAEHAKDVVDVLVLADLFGLSTHGLSHVESYGERLNVNGISKTPNITVKK